MRLINYPSIGEQGFASQGEKREWFERSDANEIIIWRETMDKRIFKGKWRGVSKRVRL